MDKVKGPPRIVVPSSPNLLTLRPQAETVSERVFRLWGWDPLSPYLEDINQGNENPMSIPIRSKIVMGVVALALPLATTVGLASAGGAVTPPNPTTCQFAATVSVGQGGLSLKGTPSSKGVKQITTVNATYSGCSVGGPFTQTITVNTPASKPGTDTAAITAGDSKTTYYLGLCGLFQSPNTLKSLTVAVKNLPWQGGVLKGAKAAKGSVGGDIGFIISKGTVTKGTYPTAKKAASINVGLTNDPNNTNLLNGCNGGTVTTIDVDSSVSTATL